MNKYPSDFFDNTAVAFAYKSSKALKNARFVFTSAHNAWFVDISTGMIRFALKWKLPIKFIIRNTVFKHFCGGEDINECQATARNLNAFHVGAILDYSVEGADNESGFNKTVAETIRTIEIANQEPKSPFCVFKPTGIAPKSLLEKKQNGESLSSIDQEEYEKLVKRFEKIASAAHKHQVRLLIDAEETWYQESIDIIVYDLMKKYNRERAIIFNTYQMYRTASLGNIEIALNQAKEKGYKLGVKLVRGAYLERERMRAKEKGYPDPIQPDKESTDRDYNNALRYSVEHIHTIEVFNGTHNEYSSWYLTDLIQKESLDPKDSRIWFAQLYGMSDHISFVLAKEGYNVAKYVPYGPVEAVMPYLFRRADENTSIAGQTNKELGLIQKELKRRSKSN